MPEEELELTPEQYAVLQRLAEIQKLLAQDVVEAIALPALIEASPPGAIVHRCEG